MTSAIQMGKGERVVGVLLLLLFGSSVWLTSMAGNPNSVPRSVGSYESEGRAGALRLLERLGFEAKAWEQAPQFLPHSPAVLWLPQVPRASATPPSGEEDGDDVAPDPRHPAHYGEFVRAGGTLVLHHSEEALDWLRNSCSLAVPNWSPTEPTGEVELTLDTGLTLRLISEPAVEEEDSLEEGESPGDDEAHGDEEAGEGTGDGDPEFLEEDLEVDPLSEWVDFAYDESDQPFLSWSAQGYGRVVFMAGDRWLENESLPEGDNSLFLVRLAEALRTPGPFLFDESALGLWVPPTKFEVITSPSLKSVTVHVVLLALVFLLFYAWVREFPRDPLPPRLDPRMRVKAQVSWFERAGRHDLLGLDLQRGVLDRIQRRLGLRPGDRKLPELERLRGELDAIAVHLPRELRDSPWRALFHPGAVQNKQDLEELGRELLSFEASCQAARTTRSTATKSS